MKHIKFGFTAVQNISSNYILTPYFAIFVIHSFSVSLLKVTEMKYRDNFVPIIR